MPYRRLPNTDAARIRALQQAFSKQTENERIRVVGHIDYYKLKTFLPKFEAKIKHQRSVKNAINARSKKHNELMRKARLYISHFIQIVNFAIIREEIPCQTRDFFGIDKNDKTVPNLSLDTHILEWGKKVIDGDKERVLKGGSQFYSPSIALVKVHFEKFVQSNTLYKNALRTLKKINKDLSVLRNEADEIIVSIWNTVEAFYEKQPEEKRRERCEEFGIVYVFRKGEKEKLAKIKKAEELTLSFSF